MDLDTGLLRAFVAVADGLHFSRAADELFLTQQAVSKRIARLEETVGVRLVDRDRHRVALTAAGERMLPDARRAVEAIDAAVASVQSRTGPLRIDVLDENLAPLPLVRRLAAARPDLNLEAVTRGAGTVVETLRSGTADISLGRIGPVPSPWPADLDRRPALIETIEVLVPADHPWADRDEVACAELTDHPLWFPMTGAPAEWTELLDEFAADFGLDIGYGGSTMGFTHWVQQVTEGRAPASFFGSLMTAPPVPGVRRVPLVAPVPVFAWWAMWRRRLPTHLVDTVLAAFPPVPDLTAARGPRGQWWAPRADRAHLTATP
ncbi:DNA-binding transcriptional LysR family regulator [Nakamurella flavida]|uniref:LysR family transcriptional regulator n=1 Tax=Nakamurella flavida TaxID=363630 RepID=UPI002785CDA5|nr:LysR family transcriptional regulator [Nakamurella flavida]MDP9778489.1 DNA-binding transcriptional LysR family regulator [Nakamurella flavida]